MRPSLAFLSLLTSALLFGACMCQPPEELTDEEGSAETPSSEGSATEADDEPTEVEVIELALQDEGIFTELCLRWGRELLPEMEVESPRPMELALGETRMLLANTRRVCRNNPEGCHDEFDRTIAYAADLERTERPAVESSNVRAVLTSRTAVAAANAQGGSPVISRPFIADIELVYVVDEPTTIRWATAELLAEAGIEQEEVHDLAMENIRRDLGEFEVELFDEELGIYGLDIGDAYDNSRVILHELWADFAATLPSPLVVVVPARGIVLASHAENQTGIMMMMSGASRAHFEVPHPVSMTPLLWTEDGWEVFAPPAADEEIADPVSEVVERSTDGSGQAIEE
ncbi:MAG: hypothetical protein ACJAYU_005325 [Bradymonadia bacterium]|jgi:uncharacterized protein YtpQ (UPF0354 family)